MKDYPRFTVIIPQKDREEYLIHTLRTCMLQDYPNFEVIVGDDCSEDDSVKMVRELQKKDSRIKLIAHETHVGMRDNFETALDEVQDGYVMALGGDDGLAPNAIWRMYEIIQQTKTELLTWTPARYNYPDKDGDKAVFAVPRHKFSGIKMVKSSDFLNRIANSLYYMSIDCPMFYIKGVASTKLVKRVKERTPDGRFYYCPTPDGYSGVVLAGEVAEYVFTNEPLSLTGSTTKSQGRNYTRSDEKSRKEAQQFFDDNVRVTMHKELASQPYSPLVPLMTADYLLTARDLPGWPGKFEMFSWEHLLKKSFEYMATKPFEPEVLKREMTILKQIAIQHNQLSLFESLLKGTKKNIVKNVDIDGFIVTPTIIEFNATEMGIKNIYDASLATKFAYESFNQLSFKFFYNWLIRSLKMYINKFTGKKVGLPNPEITESN